MRFGRRQNTAGQVFKVRFEPRGNRVLSGVLRALLHNDQLLRCFANRNLVAHIYLERRNVDLAAVHGNMPVTNNLACLAARNREAKPESHVVQAALQLLNQQFAGNALARLAFS